MTNIIHIEAITDKIYSIRGKRVMLDMDLSQLYGVETKQLKRAVKRNIDRFPTDFMFELSKSELSDWRRQFGTSNRAKMGLRIPPFAFTEHGVAMLSSVLRSKKAVQVNIGIMRAFIRLRQMITENEVLKYAIEGLERRVSKNERNIDLAIKAIKGILEPPLSPKPKRRMGFCPPEKK
jgi:hypothetical protein